MDLWYIQRNNPQEKFRKKPATSKTDQCAKARAETITIHHKSGSLIRLLYRGNHFLFGHWFFPLVEQKPSFSWWNTTQS